jgi:hypothetical protein
MNAKETAAILIRDLYDYRDAWRYALRIAQTDGPLTAEYREAARLIAAECFANTGRPIYT